MLKAGAYHTLQVNRISDHGLYLADQEGEEVLLPNRYVSLQNKVGDMLDVFVYHDSEDRLVATTQHPVAVVGQAAFMKVVDKNIHGAFLDWGLEGKDLFLPNRNQKAGTEIGKRYVVYLYRDSVTGRTVATMQLGGFITNNEIGVRPRQQVEILVALETPLGFRAVIDNRHWGMLYRNQLFQPVQVGDHLTAYVQRIAEDGRIDLSLQQQGFDQVKIAADKLLHLARENGGRLPLGDHSEPAEVARLTQMSKKVFRRALGHLLSQGLVETDEHGMRLKEDKKR